MQLKTALLLITLSCNAGAAVLKVVDGSGKPIPTVMVSQVPAAPHWLIPRMMVMRVQGNFSGVGSRRIGSLARPARWSSQRSITLGCWC